MLLILDPGIEGKTAEFKLHMLHSIAGAVERERPFEN